RVLLEGPPVAELQPVRPGPGDGELEHLCALRTGAARRRRLPLRLPLLLEDLGAAGERPAVTRGRRRGEPHDERVPLREVEARAAVAVAHPVSLRVDG